MKEDIVERLEEEINKKKKLSSESKSTIIGKAILNDIVAILIMIYFILMVLGNIYLDKDLFVLECRISTFAFLLIAIILFESSYKKEKGETAIYGIEMMLISIFTLFIPYMFYELNNNIAFYLKLTGTYIAAYYFVKSIIVYKYEKKKQIKSLSDIKEIIKKESKKKKEIQIKQEEIKEVSSSDKEKRKTYDKKEEKGTKNKKVETNKKTKEIKQKAEKDSKTTNKTVSKEIKEEKDTKKKTRSKNNVKTEEKKQKETKPKDIKEKVKKVKDTIKEKPKTETTKKQTKEVKDSADKTKKETTARKRKNTVLATPEKIKKVQQEKETVKQPKSERITKKKGRPKKEQ